MSNYTNRNKSLLSMVKILDIQDGIAVLDFISKNLAAVNRVYSQLATQNGLLQNRLRDMTGRISDLELETQVTEQPVVQQMESAKEVAKFEDTEHQYDEDEALAELKNATIKKEIVDPDTLTAERHDVKTSEQDTQDAALKKEASAKLKAALEKPLPGAESADEKKDKKSKK